MIETSDPTPPVTCTALRCALDWVTLLYQPFTTPDLWAFLVRIASRQGTVRLWRPDRLDAVPFRVEGDADSDVVFTTRVNAAQNDAVVRLKGPGLCVFVRNPTIPANRWPGGHLPHGVEVQVQGTALSASLASGLDVVLWLKAAVEALLFAGWGSDEASRARALRDQVVPGRWDLAVDVAVTPSPTGASGTSAQDWIDGEIFGGGNLDAANARIASRARKPKAASAADDDGVRVRRDAARADPATRMVGRASSGRTLYRGGGTCELCIYERGKKVDGDWPILSDTLRARGWDGVSPVLRYEVRLMRAWFRDQQLVITERGADDGPDLEKWCRGDEIPFDVWVQYVGAFGGCVVSRFAHKVAGSQRVRDRAASPFYVAVCEGLQLFRDDGDQGDRAIARVVSKKREAAADRAVSRAINALVDVAAHDDVSPDAAAAKVLRLIRGEDYEHAAKRYAHTRAVHGYTPRTLDDALRAHDEGAARAMALQRSTPPPPPSRYAPPPQRPLAGVAS